MRIIFRLHNKVLLLVFFLLLANCSEKKVPEVWFCPMHTHYRVNHPGQCPICGMALVKEEAPTQKDHADAPEQSREVAKEKSIAITITPEQQKLVGITTAKPRQRELAFTLQLAGQVTYEPEIYAAIVEYRQLLQAARTLEDSVGGNLTQSALVRLRQFGLGNDEIQQYASSEAAASRLITGTHSGKTLITLRLSEADIGLVRKGMAVKISAPAFPGKIWSGKITAVGQLVDAKNRSIAARALVTDRGFLRAQMAVTAEIAIRAGSGVSIERSAIFDTGARQVAFIKLAPNTFAPRAVRVLGGNDEYALVSGLSPEDEVVISAAFLLDAEAKLRLGQ